MIEKGLFRNDLYFRLGGQPSNFLDDCPTKCTGEYYYEDPRYVGLITLEDTLVQIDVMGIEHGYDVDRVLWPGKQMEKPLAGGFDPRLLSTVVP